LTRKNTGLTFTIAFNYGGRAELVDAMRRIADAEIPASRITEKTISRYLYDPSMPDPDLMIRTSGEYRISNFLLWELAYSELVFSEVLWPDFRREHLFAAIKEYQDRDRRYGGVTES
jgi:undecaprenyl diphosphate synthase